MRQNWLRCWHKKITAKIHKKGTEKVPFSVFLPKKIPFLDLLSGVWYGHSKQNWQRIAILRKMDEKRDNVPKYDHK